MMEYNNLAIYCDNYEENKMFLSYCQNIGLRWQSGVVPLSQIPNSGGRKNYFIIDDNKIQYGYIDDYDEFMDVVNITPRTIVNLYEFINSNTMPTDQELMRFLNG